MEWNDFGNFGRGSPKEHFCEIILKSGHWPMRRCCLKELLMDEWTEDQTDGPQTNSNHNR